MIFQLKAAEQDIFASWLYTTLMPSRQLMLSAARPSSCQIFFDIIIAFMLDSAAAHPPSARPPAIAAIDI